MYFQMWKVILDFSNNIDIILSKINNLSLKNPERLKVLVESTDGFYISEQDAITAYTLAISILKNVHGDRKVMSTTGAQNEFTIL